MNTTTTEAKRTLPFGTKRQQEPGWDAFGRAVTKEFDVPSVSEGQHLCDVCREPATVSCTDAKETTEGWTESEPRYGCPAHVVEPMFYLAGGTTMTAKEYELGD